MPTGKVVWGNTWSKRKKKRERERERDQKKRRKKVGGVDVEPYTKATDAKPCTNLISRSEPHSNRCHESPCSKPAYSLTSY